MERGKDIDGSRSKYKLVKEKAVTEPSRSPTDTLEQ
jgi:hypothetical protein